MSWYHAPLNKTQVEAGEVLRRKEAFSAAFGAARGPRQMALFQKAREDGGIDLYLTPDCGRYAPELLAAWVCRPCERPAMTGLHLLVGHNEITYYLP